MNEWDCSSCGEDCTPGDLEPGERRPRNTVIIFCETCEELFEKELAKE
jgi:hypothetical protein